MISKYEFSTCGFYYLFLKTQVTQDYLSYISTGRISSLQNVVTHYLNLNQIFCLSMSFPDFHFFPPYCRSVEEGVDKHEHNKHSTDAAAEVVDQMTQGSEINE